MKTKIIIILLLVTITFLSAYDRDQAARYAHRYTRLTNNNTTGYDPENDIWWNVNPFIYELETSLGAPDSLAGYWDGADCSHFASQCLQAGGIKMYEGNHSDNSHYLGYVAAKNLNIFAKDYFPVREDWNHSVFLSSFWIEEVIDPVIESSHFPYYTSYNFLDFCSDIYFLKIYFSEIELSYEDDINISLPHGNNNYIYGFHSGYWSYLLSNYYNGEYDPIVCASIILHDNAPTGNNNYGYQANAIKWQAHYDPHSDYQQGDFQIFCKYRASSVFEDENFEIHYENTYNDTGRIIRYKHAAICTENSGANATVSAHNADHYNYAYDYYLPYDGSNSIIFYKVPEATSLFSRPNLEKYNNWADKAIITTAHSDSINDIEQFSVGDTVYIKYAFQNTGNIMIPDRFKVKVELNNSRVIIDSVLYNGILAGSSIVQNVEKYFTMPDADSLTITVILDAGTNTDFGTDWEATWNDQNWWETNDDTDNEFSKTIYLNTGLQPPTNIEINLNPGSGTINLQWDGNNRTTYKVYSSTNPYDEFEEDLSGTYNGNSWSAPLPAENRFYYVVETDSRESTRSKQVHYKKVK